MGLKTPLYAVHVAQGAKIVDFGGWDLPLHYGSQLEEHLAVRRGAGVFDVSHMCIVDVHGARAREYLRFLLANDVAKLKSAGEALYTCMLLPSGGVIDDLIVYRLEGSSYRLVVNAGTRDKDLAYLRAQAAPFQVAIEERTELAMLAVQGPEAVAKTLMVEPARQYSELLRTLRRFSAAACGSWFIARTGYTGEDGFEIMLPATEAEAAWQALVAQGVVPAGLGARDTLRLEAGMNLYGHEMDESRHPLESGLEWTVAFEPADRDFVGRAALERARLQDGLELVGLLLEERGVLRQSQRVASDAGAGAVQAGAAQAAGVAGAVGEVTSGTFSPTLNRSIGFARVPKGMGPKVLVDIRGKPHAARVVKPPFVRNGKALIAT